MNVLLNLEEERKEVIDYCYQALVIRDFEFTLPEITGDSQKQDIVYVRSLIAHMMKEGGYRTAQIGRILNRSHSRVGVLLTDIKGSLSRSMDTELRCSLSEYVKYNPSIKEVREKYKKLRMQK